MYFVCYLGGKEQCVVHTSNEEWRRVTLAVSSCSLDLEYGHATPLGVICARHLSGKALWLLSSWKPRYFESSFIIHYRTILVSTIIQQGGLNSGAQILIVCSRSIGTTRRRRSNSDFYCGGCRLLSFPRHKPSIPSDNLDSAVSMVLHAY